MACVIAVCQDGTLNIHSVLTITDLAAFDDMANTMFKTDFLLWNIDGFIDVTATLAGISMTISRIAFVKSISLPGTPGAPSSGGGPCVGVC
jgi:hypothetical protein